MAGSNGYNVLLGFKFQSFDSVNKEFQNIIKRLSDTGKVDLKFNTDGAKINEAVNKIKEQFKALGTGIDTSGFDKVVNQQVKTFASGAGQQILTLKNSANEVLKIVQNLNNEGKVIPDSTSGSVSSKAQTEAQVGLYKELGNLIQNEFALRKQLLSADELQTNELNKQLALNKEMQSIAGGTIGKNGLQDSALSDNLIQKRIELVNQYNSALAKSQDNMNKSLGSQGNKLESTITSLTTKLEALQSKYSGLVPTTQLNTFNEKLEVLKSSLNSVTNGKLIDGNKIQSQINQATQSFTQLTNATKESSLAFKTGNQDVMSFGQGLNTMLGHLSMYFGAYQIINLMTNAIKQGLQTVLDMDTAMADLNKVVSLSNESLKMMTQSAIQMGQEFGRSVTEVAQAQAEFGKLYKTTSEINELTQASLLGANVMDNSTPAQVSKSLTTIMTAMKINASDSMTILDSMNEIKCVSPYIVICK